MFVEKHPITRLTSRLHYSVNAMIMHVNPGPQKILPKAPRHKLEKNVLVHTSIFLLTKKETLLINSTSAKMGGITFTILVTPL